MPGSPARQHPTRTAQRTDKNLDIRKSVKVETTGLEPVAPCLQVARTERPADLGVRRSRVSGQGDIRVWWIRVHARLIGIGNEAVCSLSSYPECETGTVVDGIHVRVRLTYP